MPSVTELADAGLEPRLRFLRKDIALYDIVTTAVGTIVRAQKECG